MCMKHLYFFALILMLLPYAFAADKPHILYINADDLGVMDVGYNNPKFRTPNLDQLAKEGMIFTEAYAPSATARL